MMLIPVMLATGPNPSSCPASTLTTACAAPRLSVKKPLCASTSPSFITSISFRTTNALLTSNLLRRAPEDAPVLAAFCLLQSQRVAGFQLAIHIRSSDQNQPAALFEAHWGATPVTQAHHTRPATGRNAPNSVVPIRFRHK